MTVLAEYDEAWPGQFAEMARIELQESLLALLRRFPDLSLAKPAEDLEWRRVLVSGLAELPANLG
ncbi:hypothetical protein [Kribbella sp. VKM Ac-2568]|uniref:hypothetical protein n=1 Tax=Kribbella sp. VKM Ac-2568 TaxID=2512219 RepID=UPI0010F380B5|nr:hypothetical protein [Kribbella sp. VKM Ac-2568]TCM51677.1 hypothetical protein EV648_101514 [Kribbella sp. VKM Ac-2568]